MSTYEGEEGRGEKEKEIRGRKEGREVIGGLWV
jgi:hypothetical protein